MKQQKSHPFKKPPNVFQCVFFLNQVLCRNHTPSLQHSGSSKISQPDIRGKYLWYSVKVSKALGGSALIKLDPSMDPMFWWYKTRFFSVGLFKEFVEKHRIYMYIFGSNKFIQQPGYHRPFFHVDFSPPGPLDLVTFPDFLWIWNPFLVILSGNPDGNPGFQW